MENCYSTYNFAELQKCAYTYSTIHCSFQLKWIVAAANKGLFSRGSPAQYYVMTSKHF